jgi:transposase
VSGFYLLPAVVRTYAPRGQAPVLRHWFSRDHLAAISGITPAGKLYLCVQARALRGPAVVRFLQHPLRHIPGKLLVLRDGAPIHHSQAVQAFLASGGARRIRPELLPAYAPELNPDEGIWNYLKRVELKNLACHDLSQLHHEQGRCTLAPQAIDHPRLHPPARLLLANSAGISKIPRVGIRVSAWP